MGSVGRRGFGVLGGVLILMSWGGTLAIAQSPAPPTEIRTDRVRPALLSQDPLDVQAQLQVPNDTRWLPQLNLSPAQMMQLREVQLRNQTDLGQKTQVLRDSRRQLRDLLAGEAPADQVRAQYRRMQQLSQEVDDQRFEALLGIREVLTVEQRAQMADLLESRTQELRDQFPQRRTRLR